jgi:hypothetical protein
MRTRKTLLFSGVVLVTLAAVGAGLYAQQKSSPKLSAEDRVEIRELYSRYAVYRGENMPEFADIWTEDAIFDQSTTAPPLRSRKAIVEGAAKTYNSGFFALRRPWAVNILIDPSPEGAVGTAYFAMVKGGAQAGQPSEIEFTGIYHDVFVKTRDGWKFKSRVFRRGPEGPPAASIPAR